MKLVINTCYGGFGLSQEALLELQKIATPDSAFVIMLDEDQYLYIEKNKAEGYYSIREDLQLIKVIEELGSRANDEYADLKIVEIPDGVEFEIAEYDGVEWIAEVHRTWS